MSKEIEKKEIDLLDVWRIIIKRKWIVLTTVVVFVIGAAVYSLTRTPIYQATATILIEEPSSSTFNIDEMFSYAPYSRYDYLGTYFNTQLKLLTSRSLAERVARRMNLIDRPEFQESFGQSNRNILSSIKHFISLRWLLPKVKNTEEEERNEYSFTSDPNSVLAYAVLGGLVIYPVEETRLVQVGYRSPYRLLAADMVNTLVEEFIDYSVEMRYEATRQASEFLNEQIARLREELAAKEKEIQKYGEEKDLLFLSNSESSVVNKFSELNSAFTEAQIDRIKKEAAYREYMELKLDSLPQYINNPVIQNLKSEFTKVKNEYDEKIKIFKPDYPDMIKLRARIDSLKADLEKEISEAIEASRTEYRTALKKENSLKQLLDEQRAEVMNLNNNAILYNSLRIEVENKRNLLNSLVAKQNEALVSARLKGLRTSNIKVVDRALIPGAPIAPNSGRNIIMAFLLSLFVGAGLAFFIEFIDNTVKDPEEVERMVSLPSLGMIPYISANGIKKGGYSYGSSYGEDKQRIKKQKNIKGIELINHFFPNISIAEDYRTVRTSILFSSVENPPQVISFTSSIPQEGKSTTVVNTGVSFAQLEKKVIMIDADMRKPRLHKIFNSRNLTGLSSYLAGKFNLDEVIQNTQVNNLKLISSGPNPPNPAEFLDSIRMQKLIFLLKEEFDYILIDTPPVLAVVDPSLVASKSDGVILVIQAGKTTRKALIRTVEELKKVRASLIGVIFNEVKPKRDSYYSPDYHGYLKSYYA